MNIGCDVCSCHMDWPKTGSQCLRFASVWKRSFLEGGPSVVSSNSRQLKRIMLGPLGPKASSLQLFIYITSRVAVVSKKEASALTRRVCKRSIWTLLCPTAWKPALHNLSLVPGLDPAFLMTAPLSRTDSPGSEAWVGPEQIQVWIGTQLYFLIARSLPPKIMT